jgi:prolyl-tRNA editing enzyme YbaK/EbsC (Cys-tRNA(Pro) deacylase)
MSAIVPSAAVERFRAAAADSGLDIDVRRYPEGTRTAADAAAAIGCDVGAIVKSLVFVAEGLGPVMALVSGANRADLARLAAHFGAASVRQANADEVRAATGYAIGGTPPFGHATAVPIVIDPDLLGYDEVWSAAGTPDSVWPIAPARLVEITRAAVVEVKQ